MGVSTTHRINLSMWILIYSFSGTYYVWVACAEAGITELFVKEDSAVATVWEVLIVAQNQRQIFLLLFWQSAVIVNALSFMMCVGGTLLSSSFCIICFRALWLVSRRSKPAFPSIVFINEVSLLTPSDSPWTSIYWNLCCDLCRGSTVLRRSALS